MTDGMSDGAGQRSWKKEGQEAERPETWESPLHIHQNHQNVRAVDRTSYQFPIATVTSHHKLSTSIIYSYRGKRSEIHQGVHRAGSFWRHKGRTRPYLFQPLRAACAPRLWLLSCHGIIPTCACLISLDSDPASLIRTLWSHRAHMDNPPVSRSLTTYIFPYIGN